MSEYHEGDNIIEDSVITVMLKHGLSCARAITFAIL